MTWGSPSVAAWASCPALSEGRKIIETLKERKGRGVVRTWKSLAWALGLSALGLVTSDSVYPLGCTGYCKDECYQLTLKGWPAATTAETSIGTSRSLTPSCAAGQVRIRRVDNNNRLVFKCVDIEGCGGSSSDTVVRICIAKNLTTGFNEYQCTKCVGPKLVGAAGGCCTGGSC